MADNTSREPATFVVVGADTLLLECTELLLDRGHRVVAVGAGSPRVASWAGDRGLTVIDVDRPASEWQADLAGVEFDWLLAITHLEIIPDSVLALPKQGAINFHDGPLPAYAGLNTPAWALWNGEATHGITWHLITSGVDEGDVVKARQFELSDRETSLSLNTRNFEAAIESFGELIDDIASGRLSATPQDPTAPRRTYRRSDRPEGMAVLDWSRPAAEIDRQVRALTFGPYPNPLAVPKVESAGRFVAVGSADVLPDSSGAAPGTVVSVGDDALVIAAADADVALTGLTTLTGAELTPAAAAALLGVSAGQAITAADPATVAARTEAATRLARGERSHLTELLELTPLEIPWASSPGTDHTPTHQEIGLAVPAGLADEPGHVVAAYAVLLSRLTAKDRFHLGFGDAAWSDPATAGLVAPVSPLAIEVAAGQTLAALAAEVGSRLASLRERGPHQHELIARTPDLHRLPELVAGHLVPLTVRLGGGEAAPGAVVELVQNPDGWVLRHDASLLDGPDAQRLVDCLSAVLDAMAGSPETTAGEVDLLGAELRRRVLDEWNATDAPVPDTTIHQLIEAQVDAHPDAVAALFEDEPLTYAELDRRANQLAHHLIGAGIGPDRLVGVHLQRGLDLIVSVVAVHKAGGAYVPLDPTYPADRLEHMISDSGCPVIVTDSTLARSVPAPEGVTLVALDTDASALAARPDTRPDVSVAPSDLAYCIYTSGSTGLPKGVLIEHRNVVNFFVGMDDRVAHELPATWFAVTSLSFDISVLELLYTLSRGFKVVIYLDRDREDAPAGKSAHAHLPMDFSLFYFSGDAAQGQGSAKYRLLLEGARFADAHGFEAVWTPERHFHDFGGLYPQPAVTGAAVAAITENVKIRAGSVVMPLHHPIRVAEAWSVVDNLSDGRVGISVASGWQPNDFVLMPDRYHDAKQAMFEGVDTVQRLWRGEPVGFEGPDGNKVEVTTLPRPVQPELPIWVTTAGNPESYIQAGRIGANVLTHLLGQSVEQLAPKIEAYRKARAEAGFDPDAGVVTLMLHTFVGDDEDAVREAVREPLKEYLRTSFSLLKEYAWSFPAFQRPEGSTPDGSLSDDTFANLSEEDLDAVLEFAFLRYYETSGLFGTPDRAMEMVDRLKAIGVGEIACLIDFGVDTDSVLECLPTLDAIRQAANAAAGEASRSVEAAPGSELDQSVAAQLSRHGVTHFQCTPSMARMLTTHDESRAALAGVQHMYVGGEAFPVALAQDLVELTAGPVTNMYGPTETTIWSTTWTLTPGLEQVPIGTPIANTSIYILDQHLQPLPPGVAGELWIGGKGVVRGYHERPELTAERFVPDPFRGGDHRMYRTGDLARWVEQPDGSGLLEYIGRIDHQVKIRGYRIELGEIEARMGQIDGVLECVAVVREDTPGDQQLVGYLSPQATATVEPDQVKARLRETLPEVMVPGHVIVLPELPHTPNGKIDRNALPSLSELAGARREGPKAEADNDIERQVLAVWQETLANDDIGVDDNFFDIGGHSLLIVRMHRRLKEIFDQPIALTDLYRFPTVRGFAASLSGDADSTVQTGLDRAARRRETMQRRRRR